jgi:hypothetical protein
MKTYNVILPTATTSRDEAITFARTQAKAHNICLAEKTTGIDDRYIGDFNGVSLFCALDIDVYWFAVADTVPEWKK